MTERLLRSGLIALVLTLGATPGLAQGAGQTDAAAGYPRQTIKIVVGVSRDGTNDLIARLMAQKLGERLAKVVVVENMPGKGGFVAADYVARAAPDGYTILTAPAGLMSVSPAVYRKLPYDALASFELIANVATYPFLLSVSADHPAKTVTGLVAWAKAHPRSASYASASAIFQLTAELFMARTGTRFKPISFNSGDEMVTALLTRNVTLAFADPGPVMPQIEARRLRPLATTGTRRMYAFPNVPTLVEAGISDLVVEGYTGLVLPKGTPVAIVKKLEAEVIELVRHADVRDRLTQFGVIPSGETGAEFTARIAGEIKHWTTVAKVANIKLD